VTECPHTDCPYREEIGGYRVLVPQLVNDVREQGNTIRKHGEVLAGLRGWTAGAAAAGAVCGGVIVALLSRVLGS
jgi:hypothetical protein